MKHHNDHPGIENMGISSRVSKILILGLIVVCGFAYLGYIRNIDLEIALGGFSPIDWVNQSFKPGNFVKDFPSGIENYNKSAFMHVYKLAYGYLGIKPENLLPIIIGFEIAIMALAVYALSQTLFPYAPPGVPALAIVLVIASYARHMNLAYFAQPFFVGQFYNITDALRIFAIAMFLRNRLWVAAVLLGCSFTTHPAMGVTGGVFLLSMQLVKPREIMKLRFLLSGLLFMAIAASWSVGMISDAGVGSGGIPRQSWFDLTRLNSYHWYPVESGFFTFEHDLLFIPFISFMILTIFYMGRTNPLRMIDKKIIAGMFGMTVLVVIGIIFSITKTSPVLVKLALHRSNDLMILIGLIYVVNGLWRELESGNTWRRILSMIILASPFFLRPGYPLLYSILLVIPAWLAIFRGDFKNNNDIWVALICGGSILLILTYIGFGISKPWYSGAYTGLQYLRSPGIIAFGTVGIVSVLLLEKINIKNLRRIFVLIFFGCCALFWIRDRVPPSNYLSLAQSYKEAQLWAKNNTSENALFMPDPTIYYGWRDYSQRSSFGNLREWLYGSCGYDSNFQVYQEGMRRFNEFAINLGEYLDYIPPIDGFYKLSNKVQERYYAFGDDWRRKLVTKYHIDYFVVFKNRIKEPSRLPIVFENKDFVILLAETKK
jgi:hypothetical protein